LIPAICFLQLLARYRFFGLAVAAFLCWCCSVLVIGCYTPILAGQQQSDVASRFERAVELQRRGSLEEAAIEYRALLQVAPRYAEAHANLGAVLSRLGRQDEAIASYESALRIDPGLTQILINLGIACFRAGQFARAVESLERFSSVYPDSPQAQGLLGLALVELGRDAEAAPRLEAALPAAGDDPAILYALGLAYLRLDRPEFRRMADRLAATAAGTGLSILLTGQSSLAKADYDKAVAELSEAVRLNPELPRVHYSLGLSLLMLRKHRTAIASFENELARKPRDFWSLYYLAYLHEAENDDGVAARYLDAAMAIEPKSPEVNTLLGKILFKQGKFAEAVLPLERAVAGGEAPSDTHYLLARVYQKLGRRKEAAREFAETERLKGKRLESERTRLLKPR
jgi:tetratricopeptide (TPR) repeat protein